MLLAACASPAPPDGLRVALEQSRDNENRRLLQVVLTNEGSAPVEVVRLQLRAPGFTDVAPTVREDVVRPGRRTAFPIAYGRVDCDRDGPARVVVGHRTADGLQEAVLDVPAGQSVLPRLHARDCALERLHDAVDVAFAADWVREGDAGVGRLVLTRRAGTAPVRLTGLEGSVLLTLRPTGPLPVLTAERQVEVPVRVTASRCDPHALTESKRTYDFPAYVVLGDSEPLYLTVRPGEPGRRLLEQVLLDTCLRQALAPAAAG